VGLTYSFLVFSGDQPPDLTVPADPGEADEFTRLLLPRTPYSRVGEERLLDLCFPPREELAVGAFAGGILLATRDAHLYNPDILNPRYLRDRGWPHVRLLTSRSLYDMFAYGHWRDQQMTRCVSVNANAGVWCDEGVPEPFETGLPTSADRWLDMSNMALASSLRLNGEAGPDTLDLLDWEDVTLHSFARGDRAR